MTDSNKTSSAEKIVRWASALLIVASIIFILRIIPIGQGISHLQGWLAGKGALGAAVYVAIYIVATVLLIPGSAITLLAGVLYGPWWGTLIVSIGATLGAAAAYLLGRYAFRSAVQRATASRPRFAAIDRAIGSNGWKIVALLRLSPVVPFSLSNYFFGLTSIRFASYVLVSWICMLPGTLLYVYLGYAASQAAGAGKTNHNSALHWLLVGIGLVLIAAVTIYITRLAKKALASQTGVLTMETQPISNLPTSAPSSSRRTWLLVAAAALSVMLAACSWVNRGPLSGLFGPPPVTLKNKFKSNPNGPQFNNAVFNKVVGRFVHKGGWVDYQGLAKHPQNLDAYIAQLAKAPFDKLGRRNKFALLINAYNAFTLRLILDHYPNITSIRDIPSGQRWDYVHWNIGGKLYSLSAVELMLRQDFADPRVHFAINCASIGCPPLRAEAYEPATLNAQLHSQAEIVNNNPRWVRFSADGKTLHVTELYDWYGGDFAQKAGSVLKFIARYNKRVQADLAAGTLPTIVFKNYSWKLDSLQNKP
ncbi:MAG: DUF547 domain-containing protein [Phycisphaerales bacterium]|nr:DUF547 domain-containing protein [Phycisphaerales bacterium]